MRDATQHTKATQTDTMPLTKPEAVRRARPMTTMHAAVCMTNVPATTPQGVR